MTATRTAASETDTGRRAETRSRDAQRTRSEILEAAVDEFATNGYDGGHLDRVVERTATTKRMIYYYFGSKDGLYLAVLEHLYASIRMAEQAVDVEHLPPDEAISELAQRSLEHHLLHASFVRVVAIENINEARFLDRLESVVALSASAIDQIEGILERGRATGVFRTDVDAVDVHMLISAYCVFPGTSGHTFRVLFGRNLQDPGLRPHLRRMIGDVVVAWLRAA